MTKSISGTSLMSGYSPRPVLIELNKTELRKLIAKMVLTFPHLEATLGSPGSYVTIRRNDDILSVSPESEEEVILRLVRKMFPEPFKAENIRYQEAVEAEQEELAEKQTRHDESEAKILKAIAEKKKNMRRRLGIF